MKQSDSAQVRERLVRIRDLYLRLRSVSSRLGSDVSFEDAGAVMQERTAVLADIEREEMLVFPIARGTDAGEIFRLRQEITSLIRAQHEFDSGVMERLRSTMARVRREMAGLFLSGNAARAYTAQSRR